MSIQRLMGCKHLIKRIHADLDSDPPPWNFIYLMHPGGLEGMRKAGGADAGRPLPLVVFLSPFCFFNIFFRFCSVLKSKW